MSSEFWFNNSKNRTPLNHRSQTTLKIFKRMYPDFATWSAALESVGVPKALILEDEYNFFVLLIGNSYLRYSTNNKMTGFIGLNFLELKDKQTRMERLHNLELDQVFSLEGKINNLITDQTNLKADGTSTETAYDVGGTTDGTVKADYIGAKNVAVHNNTNVNSKTINSGLTRSSKLAIAQNLMAADYYKDFKLPKVEFITKMCYRMRATFQFTRREE